MTTTWATRLANSEGHDLRFYFTIGGVPYVFQDDDTDVPTTLEASTRPRLRCISMLDPGETRLNLQTRRAEGGGLTVRILDDDDGTLAALFTPRRFRRSFVTDPILSRSATDINVYSSDFTATSVPIAQTIYIGGESIIYDTLGGTTFNGCTRGAWGSEAQKHYGGADDGEGIYHMPPAWWGRRLYLYGYFLNRDGTTTSDLRSALGVFRLEAAPKFLGNDEWEIQCSELSDEHAVRKVCSGIIDVTPAFGHFLPGSSAGSRKVTVGAGANYNQFTTGNARSLVLVKKATGFGLFTLATQDSPDSFEVFATGAGAGEGDAGFGNYVVPGAPGNDIEWARHVCVLVNEPGTEALRVLTSRVGDTVNGSYDDLPGYEGSAYGEPEFRFGAGIRSTEVDDAAFTSITQSFSGGWSYPLVEEEDLEQFLFDFCFRQNLYWFVDRAGLLTVRTLAEQESEAVLTIDDGLIVASKAPEVEYDEESIAPRLTVNCNYDMLSRGLCLKLNLNDVYLQHRYPNRDDTQEITSKSFVCTEGRQGTTPQNVVGDLRPTVQRGIVEDAAQRQQVSGGRGRCLISMACHLPVLAADIGDLVRLSVAGVTDFEGSTTLTSKLCRVSRMRPRYDDGEVDVTLELLDKLFFIAPGVVIQSAAGDTLTLRDLSATYPEASSIDPGNMFKVGWQVNVWDVSAAAFETFTIDAVTANTIQLSGVPTFGIAADVDFVTLGDMGASTGENANGYDYSDFIFQIDTDESVYEPLGLEVTRWR